MVARAVRFRESCKEDIPILALHQIPAQFTAQLHAREKPPAQFQERFRIVAPGIAMAHRVAAKATPVSLSKSGGCAAYADLLPCDPQFAMEMPLIGPITGDLGISTTQTRRPASLRIFRKG